VGNKVCELTEMNDNDTDIHIPIFNGDNSDQASIYQYQIDALREYNSKIFKFYLLIFITMLIGILSIVFIVIFVKPDNECVIPT
jgi:hypothetical protein